MQVRVEPKADETQRACVALVGAAYPRSLWVPVMLGVCALLGAAAFLMARATWVITLLLIVIAFWSAAIAAELEAKWRMSRARALDQHADEPYEIEIGETGIRTWCAHVDTRYRWDGITRVVETPEFYLFLRGPQGGPTIPKRVLSVATDKELRQAIREWSLDHGTLLLQSEA